jgi:hypothetical protein
MADKDSESNTGSTASPVLTSLRLTAGTVSAIGWLIAIGFMVGAPTYEYHDFQDKTADCPRPMSYDRAEFVRSLTNNPDAHQRFSGEIADRIAAECDDKIADRTRGAVIAAIVASPIGLVWLGLRRYSKPQNQSVS